MRKRFTTAGLLVVLLVVVSTALACGGGTAADTTAAGGAQTTATGSTESNGGGGPATGEPIKVGLVTCLTGSGAAPGISVQHGAEYMVHWINESGGIGGRPIELLIEDDKTEMPTMTAVMTKLIEDDGIEYLVGPFMQAGQETARTICEEAQIPMIGTGPPSLAQIEANTPYKWSVMMSAGPVTQADALVKLVAAHGYKNVLAISDTLAIHQETLTKLVELSESAGFTLTVLPDTFGLTLPDPQAILNKIMDGVNSVQPDAILTLSNPLAQPAIYQGLRNLGVTAPIHGSPAAAHPSIMSRGPEAVEGLYVCDSGGIVNPQSLPDDWPIKALQIEFYDGYSAYFGYAPDFFAAVAADYFYLLKAAMEKAGGADDQAAVAVALQSLTDVPTLEGLQTFTPDDTTEGVYGFLVEFQIVDGEFQFVRTLD